MMELFVPMKVMTQIRASTLADPEGDLIELSTTSPGCIGVMQVFDNYNDAKTAYPHDRVVKIGELNDSRLHESIH
jgi:hypothetical protein